MHKNPERIRIVSVLYRLSPQVKRLLAVHMLIQLGMTGFEGIFVVWGALAFGLGASDMALLLVVAGLANALAQGGLTRVVVARSSAWFSFAVGVGITAFSLVMTGLLPQLSNSYYALMVIIFILGLGSGFFSPTLLAVLSNRSLPSQTATVLGAAQSMTSFARVLGPLWAAAAFGALSSASPLLLSALLLAAALNFAWHAGLLIEQDSG